MMKSKTDDPFSASSPTLIDMGVGNPAFMFSYWKAVNDYYGDESFTSIPINVNMAYDYAPPDSAIKSLIKDLHDLTGNAETEGYSVVLGNGAAQLVSAWAYSTECSLFAVNTPRWPRLIQLAKMGSVFAESEALGVCQLIVSPNNPDNSTEIKILPEAKHLAYDLCYNWPQYTSVSKFNEDVMIFGLAKATGHAGTRLGWALVKNAEQAQKMTKYIELSTSGVSQEGQLRSQEILALILRQHSEMFISCFDYGRETLNMRWHWLTKIAGNNEHFDILNKNGMFAWCEMKDKTKDGAKEMADLYGVNVIGGESFGASPAHFRISLGCSDKDFESFYSRLEGAINA